MANVALRKQFPGGAVKAALASIMNGTSTTVDLDATTGWPTGPTPWVVTINRGGATEEQILVTSRSGITLNFPLGNRGYGATVAFSHNVGEPIECSVDPVTLDEVNRVVALPQNVGELLVFDGTNLVVLSAPASDTHLEGVAAGEDPKKMKWKSKWVTVTPTPPVVTAANGQSYYDTARQELMVTVGGVFQSAALGVVVFTSTAARDSLFGAGPAGRLAFVTVENRLYVGTGGAWVAIPKPGEFVAHYPSKGALDASGLAVGSMGMTDDIHQLWLKRTTAWYPVGVNFVGTSPPPEGDVAEGDLWGQPV